MRELVVVNMLGSLTITDGLAVFPLRKKRSVQVELLVAYLILNRHNSINNQQLMDLLWPDGDSENPEGALRNMIYRARKELKAVFNANMIVNLKGDHYSWNNEFECQVDYESLMQLCDLVYQEQDLIKKYELCMQMIDDYHNSFLPASNFHDWIIDVNNTLERNFTRSLIDTLRYLSNKGFYEEVIKICNHPNCKKIVDASIAEYQLYAYYKTGNIEQAFQYYRQTVDHYYSRYGVEVSKRFKQIYEVMLENATTPKISVEELEKNLSGDNDRERTFYCDFDVFKNIYQINLRSVRRTMKARVLALLTIEDRSNSLNEKAILQETDILKAVIGTTLRKNDVFSKFNSTQYSLILATPNIEGAQVAINRIVNRYNERKVHSEVFLQSDLKRIR